MGWLASFHPSDDPRHAHHPTILQATLLQKGQEARVQQPVETVTLGLAFCMASKKANAYMQAAHAPDESSSFLSACLIRCSLSAFLIGISTKQKPHAFQLLSQISLPQGGQVAVRVAPG